MAQGLISVMGNFREGTGSVKVVLANSELVITASGTAIPAPWCVAKGDGESSSGFSVRREFIALFGTSVDIYGRAAFECQERKVKGVAFRDDASADVEIQVHPERIVFAPGETERPFEVEFTPVDDPSLHVDQPSWVPS